MVGRRSDDSRPPVPPLAAHRVQHRRAPCPRGCRVATLPRRGRRTALPPLDAQHQRTARSRPPAVLGHGAPRGHPFWDSHRPGDRWNCKCSLEQTDDTPTAPPAASDDKPQDRPAPGLDTRPDREAQLFSPSHPYYKDAYRGAAQAARKAVDALMSRRRLRTENTCPPSNWTAG